MLERLPLLAEISYLYVLKLPLKKILVTPFNFAKNSAQKNKKKI